MVDSNRRQRPDRFMGFGREQILGGLVLPALIAALTWIFATHREAAVMASRIEDLQALRAQVTERQDREFDSLQARISALEARPCAPAP